MSIRGLVLRVEMLKRIKRSNCPWKRATYAHFWGWWWWWCWWETSTLKNKHTRLVFKGGDGDSGVEKKQLPSKMSIGSLFSRVLSNSPPLWAAWGKDCLVLQNELFVFSNLRLVLKVYSERQLWVQNWGKLWRTHPLWAVWGLVLRSKQVSFQRSWAHFEDLFWVSILSPKSRETVENSLSYATPNKEALSLEFFLQANLH